MLVVGLLLSVLVGVSLGLIGSGGSILMLPILVYILNVNPITATGYSLFIVGAAALMAGIQHARKGQVQVSAAWAFGVPSILSVMFTRLWLVPAIPFHVATLGSWALTKPMLLMMVFALIMIGAAAGMIRSGKVSPLSEPMPPFWLIPLMGLMEGMLTGLVGAGGGFLIIPVLVLLAKMPMQKAIGTSLFIIATKSFIGFFTDFVHHPIINWSLLLPVTAFAIAGIFIGSYLSKYISGQQLKKGFGWFVLLMGIFVLVMEWKKQ